MNSDSYRSSKRHFADKEEEQSANDHFFEQLDWDLEWAIGALHTFLERDAQPPFDALYQAFTSIAGRRYCRFKTAQEEGNDERAKEMEMFAHFWYRLAGEIGCIIDKYSEKT